MDSNWREDLPDPVEIPLAEVGAAISALDRVLYRAQGHGDHELVRVLDEVVGRMTRWVWPFLGELDQGEDYDG